VRGRRVFWPALCLALLASGCQFDMADQPHVLPLQESDFFADGQASRMLVPGTVARGELRLNQAFYTGKSGDLLIDTIPVEGFTTTNDPKDEARRRAVLEHGRNRFNIYCTPCHGYTGDGDGMIVRRGFSKPPSFHEERLVDAPSGHFYNVITQGYGAMYSYASRVPPGDRWAIVTYIRALQMSRRASLDDVPADERSRLEAPAK
jgi:mono/diheme cytochrome c family protein